jgi:hypothetical protein
MPFTIEQLERAYPWHCAALDKKQIALPRIADEDYKAVVGDLAIGDDGLIYVFTGKEWI